MCIPSIYKKMEMCIHSYLSIIDKCSHVAIMPIASRYIL